MMFGFTAKEFNTTMGAYDQSQVLTQYAMLELVDFPFMASYGLLLCALVSTALTASGRGNWMALNLLPVSAALLDVVENVSILLCLSFFPGTLVAAVYVASAANMAKWTVLYLTLAVLTVLSGVLSFQAVIQLAQLPFRREVMRERVAMEAAGMRGPSTPTAPSVGAKAAAKATAEDSAAQTRDEEQEKEGGVQEPAAPSAPLQAGAEYGAAAVVDSRAGKKDQ